MLNDYIDIEEFIPLDVKLAYYKSWTWSCAKRYSKTKLIPLL